MPPDDLLQRIRSAANGSASDAVNMFGQAGGAGKGILTTHPVSEGSVLVSVPVAECLHVPQAQVGQQIALLRHAVWLGKHESVEPTLTHCRKFSSPQTKW